MTAAAPAAGATPPPGPHGAEAPVVRGAAAPGARRAAVLGHPVGHSLSPVLHRAAYRALGLDWDYDAVDVTAEQLPQWLAGLTPEWAGLSLTMPLKQPALGLVDHVEPLAELLGSVNTVLVQAGRTRPVLTGTNTDVRGVVAALREGLADGALPAHPVAVVLGAGGTAAATIAALAELGCATPLVLVRSLGRTGALARAAHRMGLAPRYALLGTAAAVLPGADLVVSTLPPGAADPVAEALVAGPAPVRGVLLDVAYGAGPTPLGVAWAARGGTAVRGERMLLHQAVEQVRLMTGLPGPVTAMDDALTAALRH